MNQSELKEHQLSAYTALIELDSILKKNNIEYFLLAGSTLGAVRHKGFIPWDDDIDIGVFIKDKIKVSMVLGEHFLGRYKWKDINNTENYPRLYGKIIDEKTGLGCIDVFLIVKTSNYEFFRKIQWCERKILFKLYKAKIGYSNHYENKNHIEKTKVYIAKIVSSVISQRFIMFRIDKNEHRFEGISQNTYYLNLYSAYSLEKELIDSRWLFPLGEVEFEGKSFPTVNNTDAYLSHLYGDYMKIPNKHNQQLRHQEKF